MKIKALVDHDCSNCPKTIKAGEECLIFFSYPKEPDKREFDVFYLCMKCGEKTSA